MNQNQLSSTVLVLGTAQDGGYPHTGCNEDCCRKAWNDFNLKRLVSSLAILSGDGCWLVDITPDFRHQLKIIETELNDKPRIAGIFITHAHMGHYTGLLELGLEVMNTNAIPVYVMPEMKYFLEQNDPFTHLIESKNINLVAIHKDIPVKINKSVEITPFPVPHRNEFSETVGYQIKTSLQSLLYIPDIDSWDLWSMDINEMIIAHDIVLLDGTFYDKYEIKTRNVALIPHPFICDSIKRFSELDKINRKKVYFTHLNHTNNVLRFDSDERSNIIKKGYQIAHDGMKFSI